jgi:hypothetical protein
MALSMNSRLSLWGFLLLAIGAVLLPACWKPEGKPANQQAEQSMPTKIEKEQALEIARRDALLAYRDLNPYDVRIELRDGNWNIDYQLQDKKAQGGGPHYVISAETGAILSKRYEQ